jgi:hypothetical protein
MDIGMTAHDEGEVQAFSQSALAHFEIGPQSLEEICLFEQK